MIAFILILSTALAQGLVLGDKWQKVEEAVALPAVLIVGFGGERVDVLTLLWLGAVSCGCWPAAAGCIGSAAAW